MRKQTKLVAVLSAAALLAVGASMTSFAATGWTEEDGTWVYYDKEGYKVTDTWKKSGDYWYYLDGDGYMATSQLIENSDDANNTYYVDETGRMVANRWINLENEDFYDYGDEEEPETVWYYFQNSGKAYKNTEGKASFKTIGTKKYAFDQDGQMLFGWVNEAGDRVTGDDAYRSAIYYCGDENDGARVTSDWRKLYISDDGPTATEDEEKWFYFGTNGKKYFHDGSADQTVSNKSGRKINGKYYTFDEYGVMQSEWYEDASGVVASAFEGYYSDSDNGARKKGWFQAVPSANVNEDANADDEAKWYYAETDGDLYVSAIKTINGKKYAFNDKGEMLSGLWAIEFESDGKTIDSGDSFKVEDANDLDTLANGASYHVYYFGDADDGAMKTGNQNVDVDGDMYQFSFDKEGVDKGQGLQGIQKKVLYVQGRKIKADSDYRYQAFDIDGNEVDRENSEGYYLIGTSGTIVANRKNVKDADGFYFSTDKDGKIIYAENDPQK